MSFVLVWYGILCGSSPYLSWSPEENRWMRFAYIHSGTLYTHIPLGKAAATNTRFCTLRLGLINHGPEQFRGWDWRRPSGLNLQTGVAGRPFCSVMLDIFTQSWRWERQLAAKVSFKTDLCQCLCMADVGWLITISLELFGHLVVGSLTARLQCEIVIVTQPIARSALFGKLFGNAVTVCSLSFKLR